MSRTCDGTMDALVEENSEFERRHFNPEIDGPKRHLSSTPIPGLENEKETGSLNEYLNRKEDIFSNRPKDWEPSENIVQLNSTGNGIKKWDMTSTPMPSIK